MPKLNCNTGGDCGCAPSDKEKRKVKINKMVFWFGLVLSIGFLSYFEYNKYQSAVNAEACGTECSIPAEPCCEGGDTATCDQ